ncbi:MAG: diguanylate cyclase, partial [Glaciecola sp.]
KANEQLAHQANFDGLTGIANRRQFDKSLEKALKRGTRDGKYISLLMVDVDHFKHFNDSFGHSAGDVALQKVAKALDSCCKRTDDLAARYGGEEFCIILPNTNQEQSLSVAQEVMRAMAALNISFEPSLGEGILSVSIGKATLKCDASITNAQLIDLADKALYRAKKDGRNCIASA